MIRAFWPLMIGFTLWALAFMALYALQALGCAWAWPESTHRLLVIAAWLLTLAALAICLVIQRRQPKTQPFRQPGIWATLAATAATAVIFMPAFFISLCV